MAEESGQAVEAEPEQDARGGLLEGEIDAELVKRGAVDVEVGRLLALRTGAKSAAEAVEVVKKERGYLFGAGGMPGATGAGRVQGETTAELEAAATKARETGDRRAVLGYLRVRRAGRDG